MAEVTFARVVPIFQRILNSSEAVFLAFLADQYLCVPQAQIYCSSLYCSSDVTAKVLP